MLVYKYQRWLHFACYSSYDNRMLFQFHLKVNAAKEEERVSLKQNGMLVDSLVNAVWLNNLTMDNRNLATTPSWFISSYRKVTSPSINYAKA